MSTKPFSKLQSLCVFCVGLTFTSLPQPLWAAPVITQQPQSFLNTPTNTSVTFTVAASGDPDTLGFQWKKNGAIIPGATESALQIPDVRPSDGGSYTVAVFDKTGAINSQKGLLTLVPASVPLYNFQDTFGRSQPF